MKRPDIKVLQNTKKRLSTLSKAVSKAYFDTVLSCPLLWFGDRHFDDLWQEWHVPDAPEDINIQEWSFDEFVIVYKNEEKWEEKELMCPTHMWAYVYTDPDRLTPEQKRSMGVRPTPLKEEVREVEELYKKISDSLPHRFEVGDTLLDDWPEAKVVYMHVQMMNENTGECSAFGGYYFCSMQKEFDEGKRIFVPNLGCLLALLENYKYDMARFTLNHKAIGLFADEVMAVCAKLMTYMKYGEKHAVEKFPENPKKKVGPLAEKRPWVNASGPHILLLDRLPSTQKPHQGGTHASPKPHRRRGHWKTLNHPRYRRHPQYQKKIFVKPSFVGPKQVSYEGNIYRLVDPLEDKL